MSDKTSSSGSGIGFAGMLAIAFITLKLLGAVDWSWWWVLAPIWGSGVLWILIVLVIMAGAVIICALRTLRDFLRKP